MMRMVVVLPQPDGPDEHDELAVGRVEREVLDRDDVAESLPDVTELNSRHSNLLGGTPKASGDAAACLLRFFPIDARDLRPLSTRQRPLRRVEATH